MTASATITPIRPASPVADTSSREAAIIQLAHDVADANDARLKAGLFMTLWESDRNLIADLLPNTAQVKARELLIEAADWVVESRADGLSDNEIEDFIRSARQEVLAAIEADNAIAGAA